VIRRARIAPVNLKRKNVWPGLGVLNYYDLLAQANLQDCAPMDSTCVSNNVAKEAAVEDLWVSKYQQTGAPDGTRLSFTPQTAAEVKEFYNPQDMFNGGNVVDTRGVLQVTGTYQGNDPLPPVIPPAPVPAAKTPVTPQGQVIVNSGGAVQPRAWEGGPSAFSWSGTLLGIPAWGWIAVVAGALYTFGGGRGR
jgi:hypothetical protein